MMMVKEAIQERAGGGTELWEPQIADFLVKGDKRKR